MATPIINFASLGYDGSNDFISFEKNPNDIRITGDFVSGQPTIQNCVVTLGPLEFSDLMVGMVIVASGKLSGDAIITDISGDTITVNQNAIANGTSSLARIRPPKGQYLFISASFTKIGDGYPTDARAITGSEDTDYDSNLPAWGIAAPLAYTGSVSSTIKGLYGQYKITKIVSRNSSQNINFFVSASDTLPSFIEDEGTQISAGGSDLLVSEIQNDLITIAGFQDIDGGQGLGLAGYQTAVGSIFATLISASAVFPFTGSAQITGSLSVTGSSIVSLGDSKNFLINSELAPTQSLFKISDEGIATFRVQPDGSTPTAVEGGLYFTTSSAYIGFKD